MMNTTTLTSATDIPASRTAVLAKTRGYSLRRRLPLLIFGLLAVLATSFASMAYIEVKRALRVSAGERIAASGGQVADLLGQSAVARLAEARKLASDGAIQQVAATVAAGGTPEVPDSLRAMSAKSPLASVWISTGANQSPTLIIRGSGATALRPPAATDLASGIGPLRFDDKQMWFATTIAIPAAADGAASSASLIIQRSLGSSQATTLIERLIGTNASLKFGNASGDLWTDLGKPIPAPPVTTLGAPATYRAPGGEMRFGTAKAIANTPWLLWVDVPEASVLGPAMALLRRMIPITLVLTLLGAFAGYLLSGRIVKPLDELAEAAEAIAAGDYSKRVAQASGQEMGRLGVVFNDMAAQVAESHGVLEARVEARTRELELANRELESFSYSVSHDLRTPLRGIDGFAQALAEDCEDKLDDAGKDYLARIRSAAQRMGTLIDDLLSLSRVSRGELTRTSVNLSALANETAQRLRELDPDRVVEWRIQPDVEVEGDPRWLRVALDNLLGNAWKFTSKKDGAAIEFRVSSAPGHARTFMVRDNGAGFDMAYSSKLFGAFQRLHGAGEFPGTGIGLATVHRIVRRHGGRIWAEAARDTGAAFFFTLEAS